MATITNTVYMSIYNLSTTLASGWNRIAVFNSDTSTGVFTALTTSATRILILSGTEYYIWTHTGTDIQNNWYKFKLYRGASAAPSFQTAAFKGNTSDLTEDLRYQIEDINDSIANYRYTIKELRRFIKMAVYQLQSTDYQRRFSADADGIINPSFGNMDRGIILLQSQIEVAKSQLLRAADTNISWRDARGSFNSKTFDSLKDIIKLSINERDKLIATYNKLSGKGTARCDMSN